MGIWKRISAGLRLAPQQPRGKAGARAYAVGDVHGRLDLLDELLLRIGEDIKARPAKRNFLIFLGDLIDRGPDSSGVIERLRTLDPDDVTVILLTGNHEEILLRALQGEEGVLERWLAFGGAECLTSYGMDPAELAGLDARQAADELARHIPRQHVRFIKGFADTFSFGDYLFVHAGIRPGVRLDAQTPQDLHWIRDPFLEDGAEHGFLVVHGHTVVHQVDERPNRIGIDTGAYETGILTAIAIEDEERRYLSTGSVR